MVNLRPNIGWTIARRSLFTATLIFTGPITVSAFHYFQNTNGPRLQPLPVFAWGLDSIDTVLAVWLASRADIWRTWQGLTRVTSYIVAFTYGRMLYSATQNWLTDSGSNYRFPGTEKIDYAFPSIALLGLLMYVWLLTPVIILSSAVLSSSEESMRRRSRFSIAGLFGFTTTAAIAFVWITFLTSPLAPRTYYSTLSQSDAIREWLGTQLPFAIPPLIAAIVMLYGLNMRWWLALLAFSGAFALDVLGTTIVATVSEFLTSGPQGHILKGTHFDRWLFICGRSLTVCCAFIAASVLGVRPKFGSMAKMIHA